MGPPLQSALASWGARSKQARCSATPQEVSLQAFRLYQLRFLIDGELCRAFGHFGGLASQLSHLGTVLSLSVAELIGISLSYRLVVNQKLQEKARHRIPAPGPYAERLGRQSSPLSEKPNANTMSRKLLLLPKLSRPPKKRTIRRARKARRETRDAKRPRVPTLKPTAPGSELLRAAALAPPSLARPYLRQAAPNRNPRQQNPAKDPKRPWPNTALELGPPFRKLAMGSSFHVFFSTGAIQLTPSGKCAQHMAPFSKRTKIPRLSSRVLLYLLYSDPRHRPLFPIRTRAPALLSYHTSPPPLYRRLP